MNCNIDRKRTMETASDNTWESKTGTKRALPSSTAKFSVTYSRLCDGGAQEMSTAVTCIRELFPEASIATHRRTPDEDVQLGTPNPQVVIANTCGAILWSSKQKNLYLKYPKKRKKSIKEIKKALLAFERSTTKSTFATTTKAATTIAIPSALALPTPAPVVAEVSEDFVLPLPQPKDKEQDQEEEEEEGFCCAYPLR